MRFELLNATLNRTRVLKDSLTGVEFGLQVKLTVRIAPGARARTVVVRELAALKATYAVFDR